MRRQALRALSILSLGMVILAVPSSPSWAQDITSGLVAHWTLDETSGSTIADNAGSNTGSWIDFDNNDVTEETTRGQKDNALRFDGVNDRINVGQMASLVGSSELTISFWMNTDILPTTTDDNDTFVMQHDSWNDQFGCRFDANTTDMMCYVEESGDRVITRLDYASGTTLQVGTWYMVTFTFNSGAATMYIDGLPVDSSSSPTVTTIPDLSDDMMLGHTASTSPDDRLNGTLDEVRVYSRALTDTDVQALYDSSFDCNNPNSMEGTLFFNDAERVIQYCNGTSWKTVGKPGLIKNGLTGHWRLDETEGSNISDSSDNGNDGAWYDGDDNNVTGETINGQVNQAITFDGTDDTINAGSDNSIDDMFAGGGTITAWISPYSHGAGGYGRIVSKGTDSSAGWQFMIDGAQNEATSFHITCDDGGWVWWKTASGTVPLNQWSHIAMTFDRNNGANAPTFYVNGSAVASSVVVSNGSSASCSTFFTGDDTAYDLLIGQRSDKNRAFDGIIDDVRIYNRALSSSEIAQIHGSAVQCTMPDKTPVAHWTLDETSGSTISDSAGSNTGTWTDGVNNDVTEEKTSGVNAGALIFDGTDNFITTPHSAALDVSSGYTLSGWIYFDSAAPSGIVEKIISKNNGLGWGAGWVIGRSSAGGNVVGGKVRLGAHHNHNFSSRSSWLYPVDTWNYVTVSWDGDTVRYYLNGQMVDSDPVTESPDTGSGDLWIGSARVNWSAQQYFYGMMDDLRLYNTALSDTEIAALYGQTGGTCSVAVCQNPFGTKGEIVFNTDHNVMQYCNGSNWIAMSQANNGGSGGCSNPNAQPAEIRYNADYKVLEYCEGNEWVAAGSGNLPCHESIPGTVCEDGSIYAGLSPDGNVPMYAQRCDIGMTWNGTSCTGTRNHMDWSKNRTDTPVIDAVDGDGNTSALVILADGGEPYYAAIACDTLDENGNTDWYLPAMDELEVVYNNRLLIGNFRTDGDIPNGQYWASNEHSGTSKAGCSWAFDDNGHHGCGSTKTTDRLVRCVRK